MKNTLPCAAINMTKSTSFDEVRGAAKNFVNLVMKIVKTQCRLSFLKCCLEYTVIPLFILHCFTNIPAFENNTHATALGRKLASTQKEILRCSIYETKNNLENITREAGYDYLNITRRGDKDEVRTFLEMVKAAIVSEMNIIYLRHSKKWSDICATPFSLCHPPYVFDCQFRFPFELVDEFWFTRKGRPLARPASHSINDQFTNESDVTLPDFVENILEKGPKFRTPHALNGNFKDKVKLQLDALAYKVRWNEKLKSDLSNSDRQIPFHRNTVSLPPKMKPNLELELAMLQKEILQVTEEEAQKEKRSQKYKTFRTNLTKSKNFLRENQLVAISSDKTNRLVVTKQNEFETRLLQILRDEETYKKVESKQTSIEKQANKIIKSVCNSLPKHKVQKLLSIGSKPATFQAFIKDHKPKSGTHFPLRPIASVRNTAVEKVDWMVTQILSQLVNFVPANVKNSTEVIDKLSNLDKHKLTKSETFVSLDVVSLYPSINLTFGIESVLELADEHWHEIDNWLLTIQDLRKCLTFICYNYEISVNNETYLQLKGVPMGAHFAPPFAIISMHRIETLALKSLREECSFQPYIYVRYIDDILVGPINRDSDLPHKILDKFNSTNEDISFTMEIPEANDPLNFLDISIYVNDGSIDYAWYEKPCHSQNSLKRDSFVPNHVKTNFVRNYNTNVVNKCSTTELKKEASLKLQRKFEKNGYRNCNFIRNRHKRPKNTEKATILQLDFINDRCNRKISGILKKYDFKIKLASKPAKFLKHCFGGARQNGKHDNCEVCRSLPTHFNCNDKFLVYKFTCKLCSQFYIGETCRPFKLRYSEHARSLKNKNKSSALAEHAIQHRSAVSILDFDLDVIGKYDSPLETRLAESVAIDRFRPSLNRKHEMI